MDQASRVYRWDLDKTYLRTDFDSLRGLLRAALEKASAKVNVAGSAALLRELQAVEGARICVVSGSPRQMRRTLEEKLRLDGVEFDELVLKPNVENLIRGRFRAVRDQVGYKLPALLDGRMRVPSFAQETLFGDDAEADAFVYSLYADLIAGKVPVSTLAEILEHCGLYDDDQARILDLAVRVPRGAPAVGRIFIHLDAYTPPARFAPYGVRVVPIYNYFQAAVLLFSDGHFGPASVARIAAELSQGYGYSLLSLANSFQDLVRRGFAGEKAITALRLAFEAPDAMIEALKPAGGVIETFLQRISMVAGTRRPKAADAAIDYLGIVRAEGPPRKWRAGGRRRKIAGGPF
ncbi:MAG TPA: hypothetical protein VN033_10845 [Vulgatibacter sp.]|nr:hypothetical protein [Vulgatibacter sp.]